MRFIVHSTNILNFGDFFPGHLAKLNNYGQWSCAGEGATLQRDNNASTGIDSLTLLSCWLCCPGITWHPRGHMLALGTSSWITWLYDPMGRGEEGLLQACLKDVCTYDIQSL